MAAQAQSLPLKGESFSDPGIPLPCSLSFQTHSLCSALEASMPFGKHTQTQHNARSVLHYKLN